MNDHADIVRVGFTGTQHEISEEQKLSLKKLLETLFEDGAEFHHGDCVGADASASRIAWNRGFRVVVHPPVDPSRRAYATPVDEIRKEQPYATRNRAIVDETDQLVATPRGQEYVRSGSWSTVRYARSRGKQVTIVWPDGHVEVEG